MQREVEPEWLDQMSPDDPAARRNRSDLRHLNVVAGTAAWFATALEKRSWGPGRLLELGAGSGDLARALGERGWRVDGLDVWGKPEDWPAHLRWHQVPVEEFQGWPDYDGICANLFLHQLKDETLKALGSRIQEAGLLLVVVQEPWRSRWGQGIFLAASTMLGMGEVSRHDGWVSVRGGFRGEELPVLLGLGRREWDWVVEQSWLGLYRMVGWRIK